MAQKRILVPTEGINSWKKMLADPEKQWKEGYSAVQAAKSWESAWEQKQQIPQQILQAFSQNATFDDLELLFAVPEFKVALPGGIKDSQNDVLFAASNSTGLSICSVEAKVHEDFDISLSKWLQEASEGKKERLDYLLKEISFPEADYTKLRYQLFHRLASAVIMAKKFHAKNSMMIIQSFESDDKLNHYPDFVSFVEAYKITSVKNIPLKLSTSGNLGIYALWVESA